MTGGTGAVRSPPTAARHVSSGGLVIAERSG
jgi:hypothetical protein